MHILSSYNNRELPDVQLTLQHRKCKVPVQFFVAEEVLCLKTFSSLNDVLVWKIIIWSSKLLSSPAN